MAAQQQNPWKSSRKRNYCKVPHCYLLLTAEGKKVCSLILELKKELMLLQEPICEEKRISSTLVTNVVSVLVGKKKEES